MDYRLQVIGKLENKKLSEYAYFIKYEVEPQEFYNYFKECSDVIIGFFDSKVIYCNNTFGRRIVHIIAEAYDCNHVRYRTWTGLSKYGDHFDYECRCRYCYEDAGKKYYKIAGVQISKNEIKTTKKDRAHRRLALKNQG